MPAVTSERVVVWMSAAEKALLASLARRAGVSISEFIRRAVREQVSGAEFEAELESRRPELEALLDELEAGNARAHLALDVALASAEETRRQLSRTWRSDVAP